MPRRPRGAAGRGRAAAIRQPRPRPPPGWSQGCADESRQILFFDGDDEVCPYCSLHIGSREPATGDLAAWLGRQSLAFEQEDDRTSVEVVSVPDLAESGWRTLAMLGRRVDDDIQVLFGFEAGGRFELGGFEEWACDEEEASQTLAFLQFTVVPLIDGLAFVSEGPKGVLPAAAPGSLDGLW